MPTRIYIASKTRHGPKWLDLRAKGFPITSSWIDEYEPGVTGDFDDLWRRCIREASYATRLVAYAEKGEVLKGGLIEIGAALSHGVPVILVSPDRENIQESFGTIHHFRNVYVANHMEEAFLKELT